MLIGALGSTHTSTYITHLFHKPFCLKTPIMRQAYHFSNANTNICRYLDVVCVPSSSYLYFYRLPLALSLPSDVYRTYGICTRSFLAPYIDALLDADWLKLVNNSITTITTTVAKVAVGNKLRTPSGQGLQMCGVDCGQQAYCATCVLPHGQICDGCDACHRIISSSLSALV
jgi:hypothetical protein